MVNTSSVWFQQPCPARFDRKSDTSSPTRCDDYGVASKCGNRGGSQTPAAAGVRAGVCDAWLERCGRRGIGCGGGGGTVGRVGGVWPRLEIGASAVVVWELSDTRGARRERALRLIATAFVLLAIYLSIQATWVLIVGHRAGHSPAGIAWTAITAVVMFALAAGKARIGAALGNDVLRTEGRVTFIDGVLATAVLVGLVLNAAVGWWWADPLAGYVLVYYAAREAREILTTSGVP